MATTAAITVADLSKDYRGTRAVDSVSFDVSQGSITGFLGPNGAGKSTTLRMLVGLTQPTSGSATVLGRHYTELLNPGRRVGVLLDAFAQHSGRTGLEVLKLGAMMMGLPAGRAEEMIEKVGLSAAEARRRTGTYSLGMRQRLGVAHALLGDPRVLILDGQAPAARVSKTQSWTRPASTGCGPCSRSSPTAVAASCCPRTSCTRSRSSPTTWW